MNCVLRSVCVAVFASAVLRAAAFPPWEEVLGIVRSNLAGVSEVELNEAAVRGLLQQFPSRLILETNASPSAPASAERASLLARTNLFDGAFGYLRIAHVGGGLAEAVAQAVGGLPQATNVVKGLVFDLRGAAGEDYAEAGRTADLFVSREQPLLDWGEGVVHATTKTNALTLPLAILVNAETRGAAEALAAALHGLRLGLLIGAPTAGQASVFRAFTLTTGQRLRVAIAPVRVGDGNPLPSQGLTPDVAVVVPAAEEQAYLADPFKPDLRASRATSRVNRLTEADLVRMHRDALEPGSIRPRRPLTPPAPVVTDPVLLRGLDLLKGLAAVATREP
jgi:hypothetical protein